MSSCIMRPVQKLRDWGDFLKFCFSKNVDMSESRLRIWLAASSETTRIVYMVSTAMLSFFCVFCVKTPLFAADYEGVTKLGGNDITVVFAFAQTLGYTVATVPTIVYFPALPREELNKHLILLVTTATVCLVGVGVLPIWGKIIFVFFNGCALAPVYGIFIRYMEGREKTELIVSLFLISMVMSGHIAKSIGKAFLAAGVSEWWMPFSVAIIFTFIFFFTTTLLDATPQPSRTDELARNDRTPVTWEMQVKFIKEWWPGVGAITIEFSLLLSYKQFRDYLADDIWADFRTDEQAQFDDNIYKESEIAVGVLVLVGLAWMYKIADNARAFHSMLVFMLAGMVIIGLSTLLYSTDAITELPWMIAVSAGLFAGFIPPRSILYDRFIAASGETLTITFLIYISDLCSYFGTCILLLYQLFGPTAPSEFYVTFFEVFSYLTAIAGAGLVISAFLYFRIALYQKPLDKIRAQIATKRIVIDQLEPISPGDGAAGGEGRKRRFQYHSFPREQQTWEDEPLYERTDQRGVYKVTTEFESDSSSDEERPSKFLQSRVE